MCFGDSLRRLDSAPFCIILIPTAPAFRVLYFSAEVSLCEARWEPWESVLGVRIQHAL